MYHNVSSFKDNNEHLVFNESRQILKHCQKKAEVYLQSSQNSRSMSRYFEKNCLSGSSRHILKQFQCQNCGFVMREKSYCFLSDELGAIKRLLLVACCQEVDIFSCQPRQTMFTVSSFSFKSFVSSTVLISSWHDFQEVTSFAQSI